LGDFKGRGWVEREEGVEGVEGVDRVDRVEGVDRVERVEGVDRVEGVERVDRVRRVGRGGWEMKRTESREAGQEKRSIGQWVDRSRG
jgi:hypothetical protein